MSRLAEYLLANEQEHQRLNEQLLNWDVTIPADMKMNLHCECGDDECSERIEMDIDKYRRSLRPKKTFVVAPEHYFPRFERVIKKTNKFWIVQKKEERLA